MTHIKDIRKLGTDWAVVLQTVSSRELELSQEPNLVTEQWLEFPDASDSEFSDNDTFRTYRFR